VGVDPACRRRGIARALAAHGFEALRAQGIHRAMLFILSDNTDAQAFWRSVGGRERTTLGLWSVDL
jgi:ribosomal protein S18 acetylase RimI-like enzyme